MALAALILRMVESVVLTLWFVWFVLFVLAV